MSSFLVEPAVIDDIVSVMMPSEMSGDENATTFGRRLWSLNVEALCTRYSSDSPEQYAEALRLYQYIEPTSEISEAQRLQSMRCWMYRCTEGEEIEANPLFQRVESEADRFAQMLSGGRTTVRWGETVDLVPGIGDTVWDRSRSA